MYRAPAARALKPVVSHEGILAPLLRTLPPESQDGAVMELRLWIGRHFPSQIETVADSLFGYEIRNIIDPALLGERTRGRSTAAGMALALDAVAVLVQSGEDGGVACGKVATRIQREWKRLNVSRVEIPAEKYAGLRRAIEDAYRRRRRDVKS